MTTITRFAPSPTGLLHVGNARTALVCWLLARQGGGRFILRLDDTDSERSEQCFIEAIETDLNWLGLTWDAWVRQSERTALYDAATARLKQAGRLYPCYETLEELALRRKSLLQRGKPPIYDRAALSLTDEDRARLKAEGRRPHWRFKLEPGEIAWEDMVRGSVRFDAANLSDPVLLREDGRPLYHLPSVVDDIDLGITHVVRGEDHVDNTALHVQLFQALGSEVPVFGHLSMMADRDGKGLSKRLGSLGLRALREEGLEALAIDAYLARLGTSQAVKPFATLGALVEDFDIAVFGRATPRFDPKELRQLNARILHGLPFDAVRARLTALGLDGVDAGFWEAIQSNLERLDQVATWWEICRGDTETPACDAEDAAFIAQARDLLPPEPWGPDTWRQWADVAKQATGRKGKALFMPLRRALTGRERGPELAVLLPLIGRETVLRRLNAQH